jgi:hypothetical protein
MLQITIVDVQHVFPLLKVATFPFNSFITLPPPPPLLLLTLLLILAVLNPFTKMDCETICKLLTGTLTGTEVEIMDKEAEGNEDYVEEREKNTDTKQEISSSVEDEKYDSDG